MRFKMVILFSLILTYPFWAQVELTKDFLRVLPSPALNAMGGMGAALPSSDPFSFYYNPAQLGFIGERNRIAVNVYPVKVDLPVLVQPAATFRSVALNVGVDLRDRLETFPLLLGLGYINGKVSYANAPRLGENGVDMGTFEPGEFYNGFAAGIGLDYLLKFSFGYHYKKITSDTVAALASGATELNSSNASSHDYGLMVSLPVHRVVEKIFNKPALIGEYTRPFFDISLGWSLVNSGGESEGKPLPRTAKLGYALSGGFKYRYNSVFFQPLSLAWSVEANDLVVDLQAQDINYQGSLGDIGFGNNVIGAKGDENVLLRKGWQVDLLEIFQYRSGRFDGAGTLKQTSSGISIHTKGLFKYLKTRNPGNTPIAFLAEKIDFHYFRTTYLKDSELETTFHGISVNLLNWAEDEL